MNENLKMGPNGLRLLMDFEKGPDDGSVPLSEGGAALAPYVCPGDELTAGYGCCTWFDGEPVRIDHRLNSEAEALDLLKLNLTPYEDAVRGALTREANQNQFDGMVCQCFNIGINAFLGSSVLKSFNEGRMEDAAANFGLWTGSTTARPRKAHISNPDYAPKLKQDHRGLWRWIGPEGQYCSYMLRLVGLLYRHYAEALLFMGRDYRRTLRSDTAMELVLTPTAPSEAEWDAGKGRWIDKVRYRTPFKDVYAVAYDDRLPDAIQPAEIAPSAQAATQDSAKPVPQPAVPSAADTNGSQPSPASQPATAGLPPVKTNSASAAESPGAATGQLPPLTPPVAPPVSTVPKPAPKPPEPTPSLAQQRDAVNATTSSGIDPSSPKSMILSRRFWGLLMIITGRVVFAIWGTKTVLALTSDPIISEMFANVAVMLASSAWEYCGEMLHTWGKVKARRNLT